MITYLPVVVEASPRVPNIHQAFLHPSNVAGTLRHFVHHDFHFLLCHRSMVTIPRPPPFKRRRQCCYMYSANTTVLIDFLPSGGVLDKPNGPALVANAFTVTSARVTRRKWQSRSVRQVT